MNEDRKIFREQKGFGFLIDWLIAAGELLILSIILWAVLQLINVSPFLIHTREAYFLLGVSYVCALYFFPINVSRQIVYIDVVLRQLFLSTLVMMVIFVMCLILATLRLQLTSQSKIRNLSVLWKFYDPHSWLIFTYHLISTLYTTETTAISSIFMQRYRVFM